MRNVLDSHIPICDALAKLFAPHAEVVLHNLSSNTIHHFANCFSKRRIDQSSLTDISDVDFAQSVIGPYTKTNWNGRRLKSVSAVIRDISGNPIGLMCINHDVEAFSGVLEQLIELVGKPAPMATVTKLFSSDWRERINEHVATFLVEYNAILAGLGADDVNHLIASLDTAGFFEIRNATNYIAEVLNVSRATLYNRLKRVRSNPPKETVQCLVLCEILPSKCIFPNGNSRPNII
jgi:D-arginine utilization repressor